MLSLNDGPFLTMVALGTAGIATVPYLTLIGVVLPIAIGIIIGNLDPKAREFLGKGGPVLIPFFAFALGCGLSLRMLWEAGLPGILLGVLTVGFGGFFNIMADKLTGGTGVAGAAASSTAGNAVATPAALALIDPSIASIAKIATPQVAAATMTTAILAPLLTTYIYNRNLRKENASKNNL